MKKIEKIKRFIRKRIGYYEEKVEAYQEALLSEGMTEGFRGKLEKERDRIWFRDDEAIEILRYVTKVEEEEE